MRTIRREKLKYLLKRLGKKRTTPVETQNQGKFQALRAWFRSKTSTMKCKTREANESIEMAQRNRPTPARNEQAGRGQALENWFSSSFERKAREMNLFVNLSRII